MQIDEQFSPEGEEVVIDDNVESSEDTQGLQEADEASIKEELNTVPEEKPKQIPSVSLSDYSELKDIVSRLIGDDPERLLDIADEDPKLAERLKRQFPKRFKDVQLSKVEVDIEERVNSLVQAKLEEASNAKDLKSFREELGLNEIEFSDIKSRLQNKAKSFIKAEVTDDYKKALGLALQEIEPDMYEEILSNKVIKKTTDRINKATANSSVSKKTDESAKISSMEAKFMKNLPPTYKI
jgi:ATP-dependent Lon protease